MRGSSINPGWVEPPNREVLGRGRTRKALVNGLGAKILTALTLMLLLSSGVASPLQDETSQVLVLHSHRDSLPANKDWYNGIARGFASAPDLRIAMDVEAPDLARVVDANYVAELLSIYSRRYRDYRPDLVISTWTPAFRFLLEHGEAIFPGVPIVFSGADGRAVRAQKLNTKRNIYCI